MRRLPFLFAVCLLTGQTALAASAASREVPDAAAAASHSEAYLALFELHRHSGRFVQAQAVLAALDRVLAPAAAARIDLADAYERLGQREAALSVWEHFAAAGGRPGNDNMMKMARLYESSGRQDRALAAWQAVWKKSLPAAQRSLVEDRIVTLASELGRAGDLAAELETRHAAGRADPQDSNLLIHLYVSGRQALSAQEVIEEYFGRGEADARQLLREEANLHRLLQDNAAYERTLEKLIACDPPRRAEYLRELILHEVSLGDGDEAHIEQLRRLLSQLRASGSGEAQADDKFAAGVLVLAGFLDEAIQAYRRGTVLAPGFSDNYLLLGDTLKRRGRAGEAAALFQRLAGQADSETLFVASIDGLLNVSSPAEGDAPSRQAVNYFKWAQRLILERIVSGEETIPLHSILADVADTGEDDLRGFAALESSLPLAGNLRSTLLRELIALATPNTDLDTGHLRVAVRDGAQRRIAYGRRLLALGEVLPPDVYINIGKDLVELRDTAGAALAFGHARAISGEQKTLGEAASIYDSAGYDDLALQQYRLAAINDSTDVDLMLRFARLLERRGERAQAHAIYRRALLTLLSRQPVLAPDAARTANRALAASPAAVTSSASVTREYTADHDLLAAGLLATWPVDTAQSSDDLDSFRHLFETELAALEPQDHASLVSHVRLDRLANLLQRVALATHHGELAERVDVQLRECFPTDAALPRLQAQRRQEWGVGAARDFGSVGEEPSFGAALEEAARSGSFDYVRNLAAMHGDQGQLLAVARAWVKGSGRFDATQWATAIQWAAYGRLDPANFRGLCRYAVQVLIETPDSGLISELLSRYAGVVLSIEAALGEPLLAERALLQAMVHPTPGDVRVFVTDQNADYVLTHLSREGRRALLDAAASIKDKQQASYVLAALWRATLNRPCDPDFGAALIGQLLALQQDPKVSRNPNAMMSLSQSLLMLPDLDPANVALVHRFARAWQARSPMKIDYFRPIELWKSGRTDEAIDAWLGVSSEVARIADNGAGLSAVAARAPLATLQNLFQSAFLPARAEDVARHLDVLETQQGASGALLELRNILLVSKGAQGLAETAPFYERAARIQPANPAWLVNLYNFHVARQDLAAAANTIERLSALDPQNVDYRVHRYATYVAADRPLDALKLRQMSSIDLSRPDALASFGTQSPSSSFLLTAGLLLPDLGGALVSTHTGQPSSHDRLIDALRQHNAGAVRSGLRRVWQDATEAPVRSPLMPDGSPSSEAYRTLLLATLPAEKDSADKDDALWSELQSEHRAGTLLFDAVIEYPFSVQEFEDYLRATLPSDASRIFPLYGYLARAWALHGGAAQRLRQLTRAVAAGSANVHDFTLWLVMLASEARPDPAAVALLRRRLAQPEALSTQQLLLIAQIQAADGMQARAAATYRLIALRRLGAAGDLDAVSAPGDLESSGVVVYTSIASQPLSLTPVVLLAEAGRHLDRESLAPLARDVLRLIEPPAQAPRSVLDIYRRLAAQMSAITSGNAAYDPMSAVNALAAAGKFAQAIDLIEQRVLHTDAGPPIAESSNPLRQPEFILYAYYASLLTGLRELSGTGPNTDLVAFGAGAATPWLRKMVDLLAGWMDDSRFDADRTLTLLIVTAYRLHEVGDGVGAAQALQEVSKRLVQPARFSRRTLHLALSVADAAGQSLAPATLQRLIESGRLSFPRVAKVIGRIAQIEGPARALELGEREAARTQNDELLATLATLQKQVGNDARAGYWQAMRVAAAEARQQLGMKP